MPTTLSSVKRYEDKARPGLHKGVVSVTASLTVDLGINHNNFQVTQLLVKGVLANIAAAPQLAWSYGSKKGTFVITVAERPGAYGAWIASVNARDISFTAIEDSTVG